MIYTSYIANTRYLSKEYQDKYISIAAFPPPGGKVEQFKKLTPSKHILMEYKQYHDEEKYIKDYYKEVLSLLDPIEIAKELDGKILLCFETPDKFCHRQLVSKWFNDNGIECYEIVPHNKEIILIQPSLF